MKDLFRAFTVEIGDVVCDCDPRHKAKVQMILGPVALVQFQNSNGSYVGGYRTLCFVEALKIVRKRADDPAG